MDFLETIYFDNTAKSYLLVAGVIVLALLFKKYLSRYVVSVFYKLASRVWSTLHKKNFIDLVAEPMGWFLVIVVSVFAIDKLRFPGALQFEIYGHSINDILSRIGPGVIIVTFIWLILRTVDFIALVLEDRATLTEDKRDDQLIVFFRDFLKVIIVIIGVLLIIKACFHQPIGNVLTGLSIVGAALALAAKESLENLIASFIIFFDKPFFTGDTVKVNAVTGTVERIGLRSTRIRTGDKTLVTVPNKQMVDSVVDNWSLRTERREEIRLELSSSIPAATLQQITAAIKKIIEQYNEQIINADVFVKDISRNAIIITIEFFTKDIAIKDFFQLKENINLQVKKLLEENNASFAGDFNNIIIKQEREKTSE
jgi:MscS family membrane protein